MRLMKSSLVALIALCVLATAAPLASASTTLKFASLAPQKSTWTKIFKKIKKEVATKTSGEVNVDLFVGGVQGDEKEVVEKIRTGQLHMAAITAVGLAKIVPDSLIF
ncbi:MAG: TRAP transporter substrate-binding protein DctP, partial [Myxococcota bacterium]|nr:TRAP transporter substrate-binding protein DctP [Myxococcota bacterium]